MKEIIVGRMTEMTFTTTGFQTISTYKKAEITEIMQFASSHLKRDDKNDASKRLEKEVQKTPEKEN